MTKHIITPTILILVLLFSCSKNDCDNISQDLIRGKLPTIESKATSISDIISEMDKVLTDDYKKYLKCKVEDDYRNDKVSPGINLWIASTWETLGDSSTIGGYFAKEGIYKFHRAKIIGICYNRHLNKKPIDIAQLLYEYKIKHEYNGRLKNVDLIKDFTESEKKELKLLTENVDSLMTSIGQRQLRIKLNDTVNDSINEIINLRVELFGLTGLLNEKTQRQEDCEEEIETLKRYGFSDFTNDFDNLRIAGRLIKLEQIRLNILKRETDYIDKIQKDK